MLSNIIRNVLLRDKSVLFKRHNLPQIVCNIRDKQSIVYSKAQYTTKFNDDDDGTQPIKYSQSKAANMRINEYRDPDGDRVPWYQGLVVSFSLTVFLIYFCILREENDLDLILTKELKDHFPEDMATEEKAIK